MGYYPVDCFTLAGVVRGNTLTTLAGITYSLIDYDGPCYSFVVLLLYRHGVYYRVINWVSI